MFKAEDKPLLKAETIEDADEKDARRRHAYLVTDVCDEVCRPTIPWRRSARPYVKTITESSVAGRLNKEDEKKSKAFLDLRGTY